MLFVEERSVFGLRMWTSYVWSRRTKLSTRQHQVSHRLLALTPCVMMLITFIVNLQTSKVA